MSKKVALVGMATTSRHLTPWDDKDFEIWCLNESYYGKHRDPDGETFVKRADRWFQLHPDWDYMRPNNFNHPRHPQWLRNDPWTQEELVVKDNDENSLHYEFKSWGATEEQRRRTDFPIYLLKNDDRIPGGVVYPFHDIIESFEGNEENVKWFTNSFAYMVALAIYEEFDEIHAYGFEMASEEEYGHQRANATFWAGAAMGRDIKFYEPPMGQLLGKRDDLYGYEKIPGITKMHLEIEHNAYKKSFIQEKTRLERIRGKQEKLNKEIEQATKTNQKGRLNRAKAELQALINEEVEALIQVNSMGTAAQVCEKHIRDLKGLPSPDKISLVPLGREIQVGE